MSLAASYSSKRTKSTLWELWPPYTHTSWRFDLQNWIWHSIVSYLLDVALEKFSRYSKIIRNRIRCESFTYQFEEIPRIGIRLILSDPTAIGSRLSHASCTFFNYVRDVANCSVTRSQPTLKMQITPGNWD